MDPRAENLCADSVVVTGLGHALGAVDPMPYLKVKKLRKYMGLQDDLAVVAAGRALESAGLRAPSVSEGSEGISLGERTGLYLVVGYIPFEQSDIDPLLTNSLDSEGRFSMEAFSTSGYRAVNGLLTFRCLPNMPAFHVSVNYDIQGPYFVTYPGPGQFYLALEEALVALETGLIDRAIVGGVAHQRNFLVEYHFRRSEPPGPAEALCDAAGFLVLERESTAHSRGAAVRARPGVKLIRYHRHDPFEGVPSADETFQFPAVTMASQQRHLMSPEQAHLKLPLAWMRIAPTCEFPGEMGPASLPVVLSLFADRSAVIRHSLTSRDGISATSVWEVA